MSRTARDEGRDSIFNRAAAASETTSNTLGKHGPMPTMGVSQSQAVMPTYGKSIPTNKTRQSNKLAASQSTASYMRPSTAATSKVLSSMQHTSSRFNQTPSIGQSQAPGSARTMPVKGTMPSGVFRAKQMEARIAAENAKKKTVAVAPKFASD